jgi:hypothetical protein
MNLDEFVKTALVNILTGIRQAQETEVVGAFVVPAGIGGHDFAKHARLLNAARLTSTIVDFDIAVTVEDGSSVGGGGGLRIAGFGAKVEGSTSSKDVSVSRIQFAIPVLLPESQKQWHEELTKASAKQGAR